MDRDLLQAIPAKYERFLGPLFFKPFARVLAGHVPPGSETMLDLACGTGILAEELLAEHSSGYVIGIDKSHSMLREALRKPLLRSTWVQGVAERLPFAKGSVDGVVCGFGLMFLSSLPESMREARRVLRPDGVFAATIWNPIERNEVARTANEIAREFFRTDPPPFFEAPYAMRPETVHDVLNETGFHRVDVEQLVLLNDPVAPWDAAVGLMEGNPILARILERDPEVLPKLVEGVANGLESRFGSPIVASMSACVISAIRS